MNPPAIPQRKFVLFAALVYFLAVTGLGILDYLLAYHSRKLVGLGVPPITVMQTTGFMKDIREILGWPFNMLPAPEWQGSFGPYKILFSAFNSLFWGTAIALFVYGGRARRIGMAAVFLGIIGAFALAHWQTSRKIEENKNTQADWIREAQTELLNSSGPSETNSSHNWITPTHLIFSNGWAAYKVYATHQVDDPIGNVALIRASSGEFYISYHHFCVGLVGEYWDHTNQPPDMEAFLQAVAQTNTWTRHRPTQAEIGGRVILLD